MLRLPGWEDRLAAYLAAVRGEAFAWGAHDCAQVAARWVRELTGVDVSSRFGHYATESEAMQIVTTAGGLAALATSALGEPVSPTFARRGDIVLISRPAALLGDDWEGSLGICEGARAACVRDPGIAFLPLLKTCTLAWRVG
jgi:hypothetical protein